MFHRSLGSVGEIFFRNQRVFRAVCVLKKKKKEAPRQPRHKPPNRNIRDKDGTLLRRSEGWRLLAGLLTRSGRGSEKTTRASAGRSAASLWAARVRSFSKRSRKAAPTPTRSIN